MPSPFDLSFLKLLVCPKSHGPLRYDDRAKELISESAGLAYPIREGIPILLIEEARIIDRPKVTTLSPS